MDERRGKDQADCDRRIDRVALFPAAAAASVKNDFGPAADVTVHPETGKASFVATDPGRALPAPTKGSPEAVALAFLTDHARCLRPRRGRLEPQRLRGYPR